VWQMTYIYLENVNSWGNKGNYLVV
jgi:hypothetical protein